LPPFQRQGNVIQLSRFMGRAAGHPDESDQRVAVPTDFPSLIVAVARKRDPNAFATLFEHFAPRVKTLALRLGATPVRAEELAQETMLAVWNKAGLFDPAGASAPGWIYRIARNLLIDAARRDVREIAFEPDPSEAPDDILPPDRIAAAHQDELRVRNALTALSEDQRQVLTLSFFEEKPHAEIAAQLRLPLGTVKSRLRLAMKRLRDLLDDQS
jgi:RNA polymerase sigma-70 factor (ECF subfamily)